MIGRKEGEKHNAACRRTYTVPAHFETHHLIFMSYGNRFLMETFLTVPPVKTQQETHGCAAGRLTAPATRYIKLGKKKKKITFWTQMAGKCRWKAEQRQIYMRIICKKPFVF